MGEGPSQNCRILLKAEVPDINEEIESDQYYLGEKRGCEVDRKSAEHDFIDNYLNSWGAGERYAYCTFICTKNEKCSSYKKSIIDLNKVIEEYRLKLEEKDGKNISFDIAWRKYLSAQSPCFWKGISSIIFPLILGKKKKNLLNKFLNLLQNPFNSSHP